VAKAEPKPKAQKFLPSTFAAAVARSAAELRPAMDFMEEKVSALPETLELVSKGEKLGWDRATMLNLTLSVRALAIDPEREGNELTIEVFKSCGLDPKKPLHWRALLSAMIDIGFKNGGAPGGGASALDSYSSHRSAAKGRELGPPSTDLYRKPRSSSV
jgi:hypothetical protein